MKRLIVITPNDVVAAMLGIWTMRLGIQMTWVEDLEEAFLMTPAFPEGTACLVFGDVPDEDSLACLCAEYERVIVMTPSDEHQPFYQIPESLLSQAVLAELLR